MTTSPKEGRRQLTYAAGYVTSIVDATGVTTVTGRDARGNPTSRTLGTEAAWRYAFDPEGNVTSTSSPSGRTWSAAWNPRSQLASETDPLGRRSSYRYDDAGRLIEQQKPGNTTTRYAFDATGHLVEQTAPDGLTTRYEYDGLGHLATTVLPGERTWRSTTSQLLDGGTTVTVTAPDGTQTVSIVDTAGREVERRTLEANGNLVETQQHAFQFDRPVSNVTERDASRFETATTYDDLARVTNTTDTLDGITVGSTRYSYASGNLTEAANDAQSVNYRYDRAGRLIQADTPNDSWQATYQGGRLAVTSHNGDPTTVGYDQDARSDTFTDPAGVATHWTFDAGDRPITRSIGDATARFDWSSNDQLSDYTSPDGSQWNWDYDQAGRLLDATEPGGAHTTYQYQNGNTTRARTSGTDDDRDDRYTYNSRGLLQTAKTSAGNFDYQYDATGKPTTVDGSDTEQWTYDAQGKVDSVASGSNTFLLDYDPTGRIRAIAGPKNTLTATWADNGLSLTATGRDPLHLTTDTNGRLASVQWNEKTAVDAAWSEDGNTLDLSERGTTDSQHYQLLDGQLQSYTADNTSVAGTHQDNGYLQQLKLDIGDAHGTIGFDHVGRPATLTTDSAASTLTYDSTGRISSVLTNPAGKPAKQTNVSYDDGRHVDGDKTFIDALFADDGSGRTPLPSSLANPLSAGTTDRNLIADSLGAGNLLAPPEPRPLDDVDNLTKQVTPTLTAPIGVRNLPRLAQQMLVSEVTRLAPTIRVNGESSVRPPVINSKDGKLSSFNPYIDAAPTGLVLGLLSRQGTGDQSILDRAKDTIGDIVGGVASVAVDVARFVIDNPIARLIITGGTWAAATAVCGAFAAACVPLAAAAVFVTATESASTIVTSTADALKACSDAELAQCGLSIAGGALAIAGVIAATRVGFALGETFFAQRVYAQAIEAGAGAAQASGQLGTAKSELLAALRLERLVDAEVLVCAAQTCARLDLVTRDILGRDRFIEVKNGTGARLTPNQQIVYPILRTTGGYFPNGLAGSSPQILYARLNLQHWGTDVRLALP